MFRVAAIGLQRRARTVGGQVQGGEFTAQCVAPVFPMLFTLRTLQHLRLPADIIGVAGGYVVGILKLGISSYQYVHRAIDILVLKDLFTGLVKAFVFGMVIATVGCYHGFEAKGGAEGVGAATTKAVVSSMVSIIVFDCFFTGLFYFMF